MPARKTHTPETVSPLLDRLPLSAAVRAAVPDLVALRRELHACPELGFQERQTAAIVRRRLEAAGLSVTAVTETGLSTAVVTGAGGKRVLVRADMDALPIEEANDVPYRSRHAGVMHACGHDGHTAVGVTTARLLRDHLDGLAGEVQFVFQPAEEGLGGAERMIAAGVLGDRKPAAAFGLHLWNTLPVGQVGVTPGPFMASVDAFTVTVRGRGGHGAIPDQTVDTVAVAATLVTALQTIVSRNVSPLEAAVVTVGSLHGGTAGNIIPETVHLQGTIRAYTPAVRETVHRRLRKIAAGVTAAFDAGAEVTITPQCRTTVNDPAMARFVHEVAAEVVGEKNVHTDIRTMGGEDMSCFLEAVPGCFFLLGSRNDRKGLIYPHHNPRFDFDEDALPIGVEILTRVVKRFLAT